LQQTKLLTAVGFSSQSGDSVNAQSHVRRYGRGADHGEIHNNLAVVCMVTGRYDEAEREVQLAEKAGFRVSPAFKEELTAKRARKQAK
jgi:Flp pilus assembly protein TadD